MALFPMSIFKPCFKRFYEPLVGLAQQTPAALNLAIIFFAGIGASATATPVVSYVPLADV